MVSADDDSSSRPRGGRQIAVEPKTGRYESLEAAVTAGGGELAPISDALALVWADPARPADLPEILALAGRDLDWVALPFAGIEPYVPFLEPRLRWTCARGVYARPVAEHVVALALGGLRGVAHYSRQKEWSGPVGRNLIDGNVTIVGGGGIATELIRLLQGWNCTITVVRRTSVPVPGAHRTLATPDLHEALADADIVVLAVALTPETRGLMGRAEFHAMQQHAWLVNVARGGLLDTEALMMALDSDEIGGAALDVTDPEPLPEGHPLWSNPRIVITPHVGNTPEMGIPLLARHITGNVRRFIADEVLEGIVDVQAGY